MDGDRQLAWRELLLRRLLVVCALVGVIALVSAFLASKGRLRLTTAGVAPIIAFLGVAAFRPKWPYRLRAGGVVVSFFASSLLSYSAVGFVGNAPLVAVGGVITAVLLFGRRQAAVVLALLLAGVLVAATAMVTRTLPLPDPASIALTNPAAWLRSSIVSAFLWLLLGFAVAYAVEHIESAARAQNDALTTLRAEQARREEAEAQRAEAEHVAQQAQKLEMVGQLAAGVAHDFNNLLAVVQCWAELGARAGAPAEQREEGRAAIFAACRQGAALARQLLTIGSKSTRAVRTLDLDGAVDAIMLVLHRILPEDVQVTVEHQGPSVVRADEMDVQQVMLNFVVNARDAMPGGGRLKIVTGVRDVEVEEKLVGGRLTVGRWAFLSVEDTGPGVSPAIRERIFEPFFTTKASEYGTGLGLATVLHIARAGGGAVGLESESGRGARFSLYLPEAPAAEPAIAEPAAARQAELAAGARVLVVEDNVAIRRVIQSILENSGHRVLSAADGDRALQVIGASGDLDLLCTDGVLPGTSASAVIAAFEATYPKRPVLIVSGYVHEELAVRGIEQGRHRLLRKPFSPGDLSSAVDELLQRG
jgi:signal transduction histidine kinase/CheY-like chemotaxis protein